MAIKKTLAQNHLSELARKGRGGDTELAHVNPQEKAMLKAMGGSGGINPNTGLREYVVDPASISAGVAVGNLFLGGYSALKGGIGAADQARLESELYGQTIQSYDKALAALPKAKESRVDIKRREFQFGLEGLSAETGIATEDLTKQMNLQAQKSGLATSGTIEGKRSTMWRRIQGAFTRGREGLMGQLGKGMSEIEEWFAGETSRIEGAKKTAEIQKAAADKRASSWI